MIFTNTLTQAFVYRWTNIQTGQWYIGSRTAQGCHPDDGYICSSRRLRPLIESNQSEWQREILCIGEPRDMLGLETRLLQQLDAKNDPLSLNQHNGDGRFTTAGVEPWNKGKHSPIGKPSWNSGLKCPEHSEKMKGRAAPNKGKPMSDEQKLKLSLALKGKPSPKKGKPGTLSTPDANAKRSATLKGRKQSPEHIARRVAARLAKTKGP